MNNTITLFLSAFLLSLAAVGCGSECGDLQDVCDGCSGANADACQAIVDGDEDTECSDALSTYEELCGAADDE